jgi:DNA ligase-1
MDNNQGNVQLLEPWVVMAILQSSSSMLFKRDFIKEQSAAENEIFFKGLNWGCSTFTTFGIKQIEESDTDGTGLDWNEFEYALKSLSDRKYTGHSAIALVDSLMESATIDQWNLWYRPILIKDMRAGFTYKTVNESVVFERHKIPIFGCMLASPSEQHERHMKGLKIVDPKLDGIRLIAIVDPFKLTVDLRSREGKDLNKFPSITEGFMSIMEHLRSKCTEPLVFDGEMISKNFKETMRMVNSLSVDNFSDAQIFIFDVVPLSEFQAGKGTTNQLIRKNILDSIFKHVTHPALVSIPYHRFNLDSPEGYKAYLDKNKEYLKMGLEGVMIKDPEGVYECRRSFAWLKAKPFIEITMTVTGMYVGINKYSSMMGGLSGIGEYDNKTIISNVGSGFSDKERQLIHDLGEKVINMLMEVRADGISQNADGSYSLRFPRFKTFRGTVPGELL